MMRSLPLAQRVTLLTTLGFAMIWAVAVLLMASVLWSEQEELFDQQLIQTAEVLHPLMSHAAGLDLAVEEQGGAVLDLDEALIFRLVDAGGDILRQTPVGEGIALPEAAMHDSGKLMSFGDHRVFMTARNAAGHRLQLAAPMAERREAWREGILGFVLPMIAVLPLTWFLVGWLSRRALRPLRALGREIALRDGTRLSAIDTSNWPPDLVQIGGSFNGFMARLTQALEAERNFATNAAHELRTPVAIALAQTQQMRAAVSDPAQVEQLALLERGLQRMRRLVARLLQLARADAGIGKTTVEQDLGPLARLVLAEVVPTAAFGSVLLELPEAPVTSRIDPDAFAIILGNLLENALQHDPSGGRIEVAIHEAAAPEGGAVLEVRNGGPAVAGPADLPRRFTRRGRHGFGLGLHICRQIAEQAGGELALISPLPGRDDGFMARVVLPGQMKTSAEQSEIPV